MSSSKNLEYQKTSFLNKSNSTFIEQMYLKFLNKDSSLPDSWKKYFINIGDNIETIVKEINGPSWDPSVKKIDLYEIKKNFNKIVEETSIDKKNFGIDKKDIQKFNTQSIRAVSLIRAYRQRGHLIANLDPLEIRENEYLDELLPLVPYIDQ